MQLRCENYQKNNLKSLIHVCGIYTVHYFKYGKNFKVPPEKHDFWEMVYIDSGEVGIVADDKNYVLRQGEAFFHRPNEVHTIYTDQSFGNSAIVSFECHSRAVNCLADKIFKFGDFEKLMLKKIISETDRCFSDKLDQIYLTKMNKKQDAPPTGEQIIKNCIEMLILNLMDNRQDEAQLDIISRPSGKQHSDKIVEQIIAILNAHIYSEIDLDTIAKELFFSKTYIKTLFRKSMGTSIIQYYIKLKIEESKKLISQNRYTYTEIAYKLGFNSVHYFSRLFKAHTDMTPSEYSRSIKVDNLL